jgi:hypothetical protein
MDELGDKARQFLHLFQITSKLHGWQLAGQHSVKANRHPGYTG